MEYLKGKELFHVKRDILNTNLAQFYIGSVILAIKYFHERKFLFRDIKKILWFYVYIKLIDFGTTIILKDKTNLIIGIPQYFSKEGF